MSKNNGGCEQLYAGLKYEIQYLEIYLNQQVTHFANQVDCPIEIGLLCGLIACKYQDYFLLQTQAVAIEEENWLGYYQRIIELKQKIANLSDDDALIHLSRVFIFYKKIHQLVTQPLPKVSILPTNCSKKTDLLYLFTLTNAQDWFKELIVFIKHHLTCEKDALNLFADWSEKQVQSALIRFKKTEYIYIINALFFYKSHPERLFNHSISAEKLISVSIRLHGIHYCIELMQRQLYGRATAYHLENQIDYLLHDHSLSNKIELLLSSEVQALIQIAVKGFNLKWLPEPRHTKAIAWFHELIYAYQFGFEPQQLIDAAIGLRAHILAESDTPVYSAECFYSSMVNLLPRVEIMTCLELYLNLAGHDTQHLLSYLVAITESYTEPGLPTLGIVEKEMISQVLSILKLISQALKENLAFYSISIPEPPAAKLNYEKLEQNTRQAILRLVHLYC